MMRDKSILTDERGASLLEVLLAVMIISLSLVGLMATGGVAVRQLHVARADMQLWSAVQYQVESLMKAGYDSLATDSSVVHGYPMRWTVSGTDPMKVLFVVESETRAQQVVEDTIVLYLTDPNE